MKKALITKALKFYEILIRIRSKIESKMHINKLLFLSEKELVSNKLIMIKDKYMKNIKMALMTALALVIMCSASWAATYYIDSKDGNDSNSGSQTAPWKTIGKANSTLKAGDTVYIKKGTYKESIRPARSGEKGNYITYARNGNEEVIITGGSGSGINLENRSYVIVDGMKLLNVGDHWVDLAPNGCHNIIKNCHMEEANDYAGIFFDDGANYNKILNNTLIGRCKPKNLITLWNSSYNLIDGNKMYYGPHNAMSVHDRKPGTTNYNIIRNNFIQNKWHSNLAIAGIEHILVENNIILDGGQDRKDNVCGSSRDRNASRDSNKGIMLMAQYGIVRNNVLVNNGYGICLASGSDSTSYPWKNDCKDSRIYNNTLNRNYEGIRSGSPIVIRNVVKNNIIYDNVAYEIRKYGNGTRDILYTHNNILGATVQFDKAGDTVENNYSVNPRFVNENERDFHLQSNSPMIDKGSFLTITTDAGSGTSIRVKDARYFMDGWGIIEGDAIQIEGQSQVVRIINVDYKNNIITVDASISWTKGKGIGLPYKGSAPDIGAFEFGKEGIGLKAPENFSIVSYN